MFAIIVATGWSQALQDTEEERASCMLPLLDRPFLQHVVERVAGLGITQLEIILSHQPHELEDFLGDGARWGVNFRFHLTKDHDKPYANLPGVLINCRGLGLLAHADHLPVFDLGRTPDLEGEPRETVYTMADHAFSGWALVEAQRLGQVKPDWSEDELGRFLLESVGERAPVEAMLSCRDYAQLCQAHWRALSSHGAGLLLTGKEIEPGIWLSRNVYLHPTARLEPPVWVGEDCRIEQGVRLGPQAVVMKGSLLDKRSSLSESVVFPTSYVGQELEVEQAVVDRNRLVNFNLGAAMQVDEAFILGTMERGGLKGVLSGLFDRLFSLLLLAVGSPLLALAALIRLIAKGKDGMIHSTLAVKLPLKGRPNQWPTFRLYSLTSRHRRGLDDIMFRFLPGLVNVIRGDLSLVGLAPVSAEQAAAMDPGRIELYTKAKAGLVEEASVVFGPEGGEDELFVAEAFYTAQSGIRYDLGLLWKYLLACLSGRHGRPAA